MSQCAANGPMYLWHAAQTIGILHAGIAMTVRFTDLAGGEKITQVLSGGYLTGVRTRLVNACIKSGGGSAQRLEGHRSSEIEEFRESKRSFDRECSHAGHCLRAVQQRQPLLGPENQGLHAGPS